MPHPLRSEDLSFVERAPVVVRAETTVPASPAAVWPAFADAPAWVEWFRGMKDAHYTSPPPHGVGSTRSVRVMGLAADETILAFEPGARFAFRVDAANLPALDALVEVVTLEPAGAGTRVVYRQAFAPKPWFRPLLPLLRRQMQRGLQRGLDGLAGWVAARGNGSHGTENA
jgi:uncharacterized protein YndB with AHSA1/START domain